MAVENAPTLGTSVLATPTLGDATINFPLNSSFATGAVNLSVNPALLAALTSPTAALPATDTVILGGDISIAPGNPITLGAAQVGFSADANASIGIFASPASVRTAVLNNAPLVSDLADSLSIPGKFTDNGGNDIAPRFVMLRWGYDISGTASGTVALAPTVNLTFSADAGTKGFYALVQAVPSTAFARPSLANLFTSWKLPSQVSGPNDLLPFSTIITEVDGSFNVAAKVAFGYEFNWIRTIQGGGLKGDIGLKLETALSTSIGFGLSGKYAVVLARESEAEQIRIRIYKLRVSNLNLGFEAAITATPFENVLPSDFNDLLKAVLGVHGQQIVKLLGQVQDWTDPNTPIFGPFVNLVNSEAQNLIKNLTGVADLAAAFESVKARIQNVFDLWSKLPQSLTTLLWSKLPDAAAIADISTIAGQVANFNADDLTKLIETSLAGASRLNSTQAQALEAMAVKGLFSALQDDTALAGIQKAAGIVQQILDGSALQSFLTKLQSAVNTKLDFTQIQSVVDQTSFDSLDTWLKARLETFLEQSLVGAQGLQELSKLRAGLAAILARKDALYAEAIAVLNRDFTFDLHATYQRTTTSAALLDVTFDFSDPGSQAAVGLQLALGGKFDDLLLNPRTGVSVTNGVLAFGIRKETHVSITLPHFSTQSSSVTDAVASLQTVDSDSGGVLYSLQGSNLYTVKNDFSSALTIALAAPANSKNVLVHSSDSASYRYDLDVIQPVLTQQGLVQQYITYANTYFESEFAASSPGSFRDWVGHIAPAGGNFGNSLLSLNLSLPPAALNAWLKAPASDADVVYKQMSMVLQMQFRQVLHDQFFSNLKNYKDTQNISAAVMVFTSLPAFTDAKLINGGNEVQFLGTDAPGNTIYWDFTNHIENIFNVDRFQRMLFNQETISRLTQKMQVAATRLQEAGDQSTAQLYTVNNTNINKLLTAVLQGDSASPVFINPFFIVEGGLVKQARSAGQSMATFRANQFANSEQARTALAQFGATFLQAFNSHLGSFAVGSALMPLGTAIYAAVAATLDPTVSTAQAAMFRVQTLKPGITTLTPQDTDVLRSQVVVHAP